MKNELKMTILKDLTTRIFQIFKTICQLKNNYKFVFKKIIINKIVKLHHSI
jgi:hypothetical protein